MDYLINKMKQIGISRKSTELSDEYTIEDLNKETKQAIQNIEKKATHYNLSR